MNSAHSYADHTALLTGNHVASGPAENRIPAWKVTVLSGIAIASSVLAANVGVLAWSSSSFPPSKGISTVFTGRCESARSVTIWVDLAINILSTLLLAASNNCAQILSSPSRGDIDRAHGQKAYLDIGVPSIRNLKHIPFWRTFLWILLFISSIPLHLLYNSVIFSTRLTNNYDAFAVTADFLKDDVGNSSSWIDARSMEELYDLRTNVSDLKNLTAGDCLKTYGQTKFLTQWRNVLAVTDGDLPPGNSILNAYSGSWSNLSLSASSNWLCNGVKANLDFASDLDGQYALGAVFAEASAGLFHDTVQTARTWESTCDVRALIANGSPWRLSSSDHYKDESQSTSVSAVVQYCLAQETPEICSIKVNTNLLWIVVACNAIKVVSLCMTCFTRTFTPLVTIGDAIESFLKTPELGTVKHGPISTSDARNGKLPSAKYIQQRRTIRPGRSRANVASRSRWAFCIIVCGILLVIGLGLLIAGTSEDKVWNFGTFDVSNLVELSLGLPLTANVVLANTPQVSISFAYLFYNNILTCMLLADEYAKFAYMRKSLRVSRPKGQQRSTFWLQVPYKFSLPMLSMTALLHWLIARSLFFVEIDVTNPDSTLIQHIASAGETELQSGITGCAFSPGAALAALALWMGFIITLVFYSQKRLHPGIPIAGSCSLAISAACHPPQTDLDVAMLPLQYGVYVEDDEHGVVQEKVGFSSESVTTLDHILHYYEYEPLPPDTYAQKYEAAMADLRARQMSRSRSVSTPSLVQKASGQEAAIPLEPLHHRHEADTEPLIEGATIHGAMTVRDSSGRVYTHRYR